MCFFWRAEQSLHDFCKQFELNHCAWSTDYALIILTAPSLHRAQKKEGNTSITMIFVGVGLLENSITVWIRKLNLILNLQNLIHSGTNIDIERSYEHFFSIQKVLQLVVISCVVLEIKPSNTKNDWKILSQRNTQNWR